jgi:CBS domain-containing protein
MSPRSISDLVQRKPALLHVDETLETAVRRVLDSQLAALPVVDAEDRYRGIFGEREFMDAVFPGYFKHLKHAGFVPRSLDEALEKRGAARHEPVGQHTNTEHVEVNPNFSDAQLAETFLHHHVLIVPVVADGRIDGVITRRDFFRTVAERFLEKA